MSKVIAHVSDKKKKEVEYIKKLFLDNRVVLIADLTNLPSAQLQTLKTKLKSSLKIRVTKKRLMRVLIFHTMYKLNWTPQATKHLPLCFTLSPSFSKIDQNV